MKGSWAAGLAAGANFLANRLQSDYESEQKQKLYQMQQDAEMKRQQFLEKYKADLDEANAAKKYEREKDDVVGTFKDPETGTYFGRTKGGENVLLHATSEDYQNDLSAKRDQGIEKGKLGLAVEQARILRTQKQGENYASLIEKRNQPKPEKTAKAPKDPDENYIRAQYNKSLHEMQYPVDPTTGKPSATPVTNFNRAEADAKARSVLSDAYGQEKVDKILGNSVKDQVAAGFDRASAVPASDQKSPTQPNAPSVGQLQAAANAALRAGKDPAAVEAHLLQKMKEYGYTQ